MFAGNLQGLTQTLPLAIYAEFSRSFDVALTIGALLVAISATLLLALKARPLWVRSDSTSLFPSARFRSS